MTSTVVKMAGRDSESRVPSNGDKVKDIVVVTADGQLSCVGRDLEYIPTELGTKYGPRIRRLDLSFNCLRDIRGVEEFSNLEELVLDNNLLDDHVNIPYMPNLHTLTFNKNDLTNLDGLLDKLSDCTPSLTYLSLLGNKACPNQLSSPDKDEEDYQRYRYYVLYRFPGLKFLDSSPVKQAELQDARRMGPYLKIVRPNSDDSEDRKAALSQAANRYTPLPSRIRDDPAQATFGKCRYVYYGRHSEGNRFIRNNDL